MAAGKRDILKVGEGAPPPIKRKLEKLQFQNSTLLKY